MPRTSEDGKDMERGKTRAAGVLRADRLRESAHARGYTAQSIAGVVGVEPGTVRSWWQGRSHPRPGALSRYAAAVGRPISWFYGEEDAGPPGLAVYAAGSAAEAPAADYRLSDLARRVAGGEPLGQALGTVTGHDGSSRAEARHWESAHHELFDLLVRLSHGQWEYFSDVGKARFILDLIAQIEAGAAAAVDGDGAGERDGHSDPGAPTTPPGEPRRRASRGRG